MKTTKQVKKAQVSEEALEKLRASFHASKIRLEKLSQENLSNEKKEFGPEKIE